jgi:L-aminopeptidase/D-esterase-like protein
MRLDGGIVVAALAVVNAFGGVRDPESGRILAGPRLDDGTIGDTVALLEGAQPRWGENTTLGVVATNASLAKAQATKVAQMAHDGLARAIEPVHTSVDGDVVFAASADDLDSAPDVVGAWGARVLERAVLRAVYAATGMSNIPALSEL